MSLVMDVFGSWWGVFEFTVIIVIIAILSITGSMVISTYFTKDRNDKYKSQR